MSRLERQRAGGAVADTFRADFLQAIGQSASQWYGEFYVEPAADKRQPEWLTRLGGDGHADAARDAFSGFKNYPAGLADDFKRPPVFAGKCLRIHAVIFGGQTELAIVGSATIAVTTPAGCGLRCAD